ncbi:hypothetical protein CKO35_11440 [Ectothiorhodospira shaposhnikovii]|uniref:KilA-N domain-containing protein n=1 Tax=Ectothiorhodospira shaposhnikovii TaxID=1054 RepID=UPI001903D4C0|nr:hypothetical protein [Ectothiorhodospira shaposhnikovii]
MRQDGEGRYCLNDLHKAAGAVSHQQPAKFFANQQAKDLISEIGEQTAVSVVRGRGKAQGTYVCKELVYAYAMWISTTLTSRLNAEAEQSRVQSGRATHLQPPQQYPHHLTGIRLRLALSLPSSCSQFRG